MLILKLAWRNLSRHRRRTLFTGLTIAGTYILFSLSLSMTEGSYSHIIDKFIRAESGHAKIYAQGYHSRPSMHKAFSLDESIINLLSTDSRKIPFAPRVRTGGMGLAHKKSLAMEIIGVIPTQEGAHTSIKQQISEGEFLSPQADSGVLIGFMVAKQLKLNIGEQIAIISQGADGLIANDLFTIKGIIGHKDSNYSRHVIFHLQDLQEFLELGDKVHEIALFGQKQADGEGYEEDLQDSLKKLNLEIFPWQVVQGDFYKAMQTDKKGNNISFLILLILTALGVLNTVLMSTLEKTKEYGIMRALGTKPTQIIKLTLTEVSMLVLSALAFGVIAGTGVNYYFATVGFELDQPFDIAGVSFRYILGEISWYTTLLPAAVVFLTAILVSLYPALKASQIKPITAMQSN